MSPSGILRPSRHSSSLNRRFIAWVLLGELAFAMVLGVTVGLYGLRVATIERLSSLERISGTVMASLVPLVAEEDIPRIDAQLKSVISADTEGILFVRVLNEHGEVISHWETVPEIATVDAENPVWKAFTDTQVVETPAMLDGKLIGQLQMGFAPQDLGSIVFANIVAALLVVLSVALVSAPWTAWLVLGAVVEPLEELRDGTRLLAGGRRDIVLHDGRRDEIGQLAVAFDDLTVELAEKEARLAEFQHRQEDCIRDLAKAKDDIERVDRMKSDFVAIASHELRTPLSVVSLYAEMLEEDELGDLSDESKDAAKSISAAASRLTSIVCNLMDAALLERGLLPLEFTKVELAGIVRDAVKDGDLLARTRGVRVVLNGDVCQADAQADPVRVRQVLDNLISNAVRYSDGETEVAVEMELGGTDVVIGVTDHGHGIPEDRRQDLFRLFGRLVGTESRDRAGLGLGLAISSRIAHAHGGSIRYSPNPDGRGSTFSFVLPLEEQVGVPRRPYVRIVRAEQQDATS